MYGFFPPNRKIERQLEHRVGFGIGVFLRHGLLSTLCHWAVSEMHEVLRYEAVRNLPLMPLSRRSMDGFSANHRCLSVSEAYGDFLRGKRV